MRLFAKSFLIAWLVVGLAYLPAAQADSYLPDTGQSTRLTDYLHSHRLPLVGAQVLSSDSGGRTVLLYGYTATNFGKEDAETKTRRFLKDADISITNRIRVRPELLTMKSPPAAAPPAEAAPSEPGDMGGVNSYENQQAQEAQQQQQQYMNQQTNQYMNQGSGMGGLASTLIPLLGMGLAIGLGGSGSGFGMGVSPGFGGSFGNYGSPYGSYGSPYGGYGSPYGGYSSPYGTTTNPYSPGPGSTGTYP